MLVGLWLVITIQFGLVLWLGADKFKRGGFGRKTLTNSHTLHSVHYKKSSYSSDRGWAWRCSCGVGALLNDYGNPTEERAMNAWKKHQTLYSELVLESAENPYKVLFEDKRAELETYKKTCYCKDVH